MRPGADALRGDRAQAPPTPTPEWHWPGLRLQGIGATSAPSLAREVYYRQFANRRQVGSYIGLAPSPYDSGETLRRHCPHSGAHSEQTFEKGSGFLTPAEAAKIVHTSGL